MKSFTYMGELVCLWYNQNKRHLPWRESANPYNIWVSEIILQQTRVEQGLAYYYSIINAFPSVTALANSKPDDLLKLWQGLGYYSRARNMHVAANQIVSLHNGTFPASYSSLVKLKGIGPYTAAALASIAFNERVAAVDGNVFRVLARLFKLKVPVNTGRAFSFYASYSLQLMGNCKPGVFNQAMMELGALVCLPAKPDCKNCPLSGSCLAYGTGSIHEYPVKIKKAAIKLRYFYYLVIQYNNQLVMKKRQAGDIWQGLFDFRLISTSEPLLIDKLLNEMVLKKQFIDSKVIVNSVKGPFVHKLTHQSIKAFFIELVPENEPDLQAGEMFVPFNEVHEYAVPVLIDRYLKKCF